MPPTSADLRSRLLAWYDEHARDLPWREPSASPWAVLVSEFMLQQTPVARVLPVYERWLRALADARPTWPPRPPGRRCAPGAGSATRAGRCGCTPRPPRSSSGTAARCRTSYDDLLALPGVGDYTAAAVASFAYGRRHAVLDTNVRRVLARAVGGVEFPATPSTRAERDLADRAAARRRPDRRGLGGGHDGARRPGLRRRGPRCAACPVADLCAWRAAGYPAYDGPPRRGQTYDGTDRQCRGRLLGVLRDSDGPVHRSRLDAAWPAAEQRERCLRLAGRRRPGGPASPTDAYALP